ncbi:MULTISPECIES: response regulator [unclassified Neptuniibacter]|uniref:response regulator n=1 Tax=unclassified Neptuniibacter TaxID=2630693 RepID=UPI0025CF9E61|nr:MULTISPECIES: response regulator [unclassified Neptuniibacter]
MRILIVDDSKAMQVILRRGVEKIDCDSMEIQVTDDGQKALDIIRVWRPSLVLSDWHMPEMTGIELLNAINREMLDINVGFVTTETSSERVKEAKNAGAKFILNKPFNDDALHQTVLPFFTDNTELDEHEEAFSNNGSITLPSVDIITKILNIVSKNTVNVEIAPSATYESSWSPCLLGLFADTEENKVRAISILTLPAACILGGSIDALPASTVQSSIDDRTIPQPILDNCEKLLRVISATIKGQNNKGEMQLRSVNYVPKVFPKIESLFQKPESERVDYEISIPGYGQGSLTIIKS